MNYIDELRHWVSQFTGSMIEPTIDEIEDLCDYLRTEPRTILKRLYADIGFGIQFGVLEWLCGNNSSVFCYCSDKLKLTVNAATCNVRVIRQYSLEKESYDFANGLDRPAHCGTISQYYPICLFIEDLYSFQPNNGIELLNRLKTISVPLLTKVSLPFDTDEYSMVSGNKNAIRDLIEYFEYAGFRRETSVPTYYEDKSVIMIWDKNKRLNRIPSFV